jgi:hypothetical protein
MQTLDNVIELLKDKRSDLSKTIEAALKLQSQVRRITSDIQKATKILAASKDRLPLENSRLVSPPSLRNVRISLADRAWEVMSKDQAMKTAEISAALNGRGYQVGGKKPLVTLYSALNRSKKVVRTEDGSWLPVIE